MLERTFQTKVIRKLKTLPDCWFFKTNELSIRGIPDIIGLINGKFFALEIKRSKGSPTKLQIYTINLIKKAKGYAQICYPENFEKIFKELKEL